MNGLNNFFITVIPMEVIKHNYELVHDEFKLYDLAQSKLETFNKPVTDKSIGAEMNRLNNIANDILLSSKILYN